MLRPTQRAQTSWTKKKEFRSSPCFYTKSNCIMARSCGTRLLGSCPRTESLLPVQLLNVVNGKSAPRTPEKIRNRSLLATTSVEIKRQVRIPHPHILYPCTMPQTIRAVSERPRRGEPVLQGENMRECGPCISNARNGKSHQPCGIGASRTRNNRIAQSINQHVDEKEQRTDSELEVESGTGSILSA